MNAIEIYACAFVFSAVAILIAALGANRTDKILRSAECPDVLISALAFIDRLVWRAK